MISRPNDFDTASNRIDNRVPMECSFALVADAANQEASGKLNVLGVFDRLTPDKFPYLHPQMFLIASFRASPAEFGRKKDFEISFLDPDARVLTSVKGSAIVPKPDAGMKATLQIVLQMVNTPFPKPGPYEISVFVGGDQKASVPLEAIARKVPKRRGNGRRKQNK